MANNGSTHLARTMMLSELSEVMDIVNDPDAPLEKYRDAIIADNCLGKPTMRSREDTFRHLKALYSFDMEEPFFVALKYFWKRDIPGRPLLALIAAFTRDSILRQSSIYILALTPGESIKRDFTEQKLEVDYPHRYSHSMIRSAAQNINGTWTQSGHLQGRITKVRTIVTPTSGAVAFTLFLNHLQGVRGEELLTSPLAKLIDARKDQMLELAQIAGAKSWLVWRQIHDVIEVGFPQFRDLGV